MNVKKINIHAIFVDKNFFMQEEEATNWVVANGFSAAKALDGDSVWAFEQRPKSDFVLGAFGEGKDFQMIMLGQGVGATIGELTEDAEKNAKRAEAIAEVRKKLPFSKVDEAKRIVTGPVLVPYHVDLQGDFELPEDIEKAAHGFIEDARKIGVMHRKFGDMGVPVESWVLREDFFVDNGAAFKIYPRGTWMMSVKVTNDDVWKDVLDGKLTGFSIGFRGTREAAS